MSTIVSLRRDEAADSVSTVKTIRQELGLTLSQAATALETSAGTVENWERNPGMGPGEVIITNKLQAFVRESDNASKAGKNLLFGHYPLRLARELLELSVDEIATNQGYTKSSWLKLESNSRSMNPEKLEALEEDVRIRFAELCM